jgi:acyl-CoA thioester hydrolase
MEQPQPQQPQQTEFGRWPISIDIPVAWGDMDSLGHVNNAVYLRWFESARITYLSRAGLLDRLETDRVGPILARASVDFRKPIRYPDTVKVGCTVLRVGTSSFVMRNRITCAAHGAEIAAEGETVVVMMDYRTGQKLQIDATLRARIAALEAQGSPPAP